MKYGFIVPLLTEYDVKLAFDSVSKACADCGVEYNLIFALNSKLSAMFSKIRNEFIENKNVKAFMVDRPVDQYKLITLAMEKCDGFDATIIYAGKEEINVDVVKAFITSHQAGNKIVYLRKVFRGIKKLTEAIKAAFYRLGIKILNVFKDVNCETDIQLLDCDVVKTINQLPGKNRQLRVLDSLLYYTTDVIHLEVDSKEPVNQAFTAKDKSYFRNATVAYVGFGVGIVSVVLSAVAIALKWNFHYLIHCGLGFAFLAGLLLSLVFNTRKTLAYRAGKQVEPSEYVALKDKVEYYNM